METIVVRRRMGCRGEGKLEENRRWEGKKLKQGREKEDVSSCHLTPSQKPTILQSHTTILMHNSHD